MGGELVVKRATCGIFDRAKGVFLNRGVFVKAPPSFYAQYPSSFEAPPQGWEKLKVHLRVIPEWDQMTGLARQMYPPPPDVRKVLEKKPAEPETTTTAAPEVTDTVTAEVTKPKAEPTVIPAMSKAKKKKRNRNAVIR